MKENEANAGLEKQILAIFSTPQVAALATLTREGKPWVRYVTVTADADLTLRFPTDAPSRKVEQIRACPDVHLTCGHLKPPHDSSWLQIAGRAEVSTDAAEKRAYWQDEWRRYFIGPDNPIFVIVHITPSLIEYYPPHTPKPKIWRRE